MAVAAGGGSQRISLRQQGKTLAADKGEDYEYFTMPGEGGKGVFAVAKGAGGGAGGGGAAAGRRYDEDERVDVNVQMTLASSLISHR